MSKRAPKTVQSKDPLIFLHKCDICLNDNYAIYIPQLDKWYCASCIGVASSILDEKQ